MRGISRYNKLGALTLAMVAIVAVSCNLKKKDVVPPPQIPFPSNGMAEWLQSQVDSSHFSWYLDPKATVSAFCNDQFTLDTLVSTKEVVITGEGLFHARAEVQLTDKKLVLTLERPFKQLGEKSIWQIVKYEEIK